MVRRWILVLSIILVLAPVVPSQGANVNYALTPNNATVNMHLVLQENLTDLPSFSISLDGSNSSALVQPMNAAIAKLVPRASITGMAFHARTSNVTSKWSLTEDFSFVIEGANNRTGSIVESSIAYVWMNASQSIQIAGQEVNAVGQAYLLKPLDAQPSGQTAYFINGATPRNAIIPRETTLRFWLLDFHQLPLLTVWTSQQDVLGQRTTWTYAPASPSYNLTLGHKTPEGVFLYTYVAFYQPSISVTVPANAFTDGQRISFAVPTSTEILMPIIVLIAIIILAAALVVDRRLTKPIRSRRRRDLSKK